MLEKLTLEGKVAVVTGGGGGLGTAISLALAEAGADIIVTDFRPKDGENAAAEVVGLGRRAVFIAADVTKSEEVNGMMSRAISRWGKVDILVNCAGVVRGEADDRAGKPFWEITDQEWHLGIDTNLTGAFFCSRAVAKHMVERKWGRIINIASGFGLRGLRNGFMYCCAKGGVAQLTRVLALTFAQDGINCNCIAPGLLWHVGQFARSLSEEEARESRAARGRFIPNGRVGEPREIGALVVYLASDASDYVTGEVFAIDGGTLASGSAPTGYAPVIPI